MDALTPTQAFETRIAQGLIEDDSAQRTVLLALENLKRMVECEPERPRKNGVFAWLLPKDTDPPPMQGLYLWGAVGRGKSMLMDMFFHSVNIPNKRRVHFHAFMLEMHARMHAWRQNHPAKAKQTTPVEPVAEMLARETQLLCLDEMQVTDVADAMILEKLFLTLFELGVSVVFTSNRPPEALYQGGLQRDRFLKFVALVRGRMDVLELSQGEDYRLKQIKSLEQVYAWPINAKNAKFLRDAFDQLIDYQQAYATHFDFLGRSLAIPHAYGGVVKFTFDELCGKPLGVADYLTVARHFHTVLVEEIPLLSPERRNEAKRFVLLIDTLYEHKVKLICTAAAPPEKLYEEGHGSFEFARTVSRLAEMQSSQYLGALHVSETEGAKHAG